MTDHPPDHGQFEELAAGYALDALEPADEQRFLRHAGQCPACTRMLADFREVAAALADTAPPAEPRPQLADRILAAALDGQDPGHRAAAPTADSASPANFPPPSAAEAAPRALPPGVVPLRPRPRRWLRPVSAAAAAALIAGGGTWAGLAATTSGSPQPPAACTHAHACAQVTLIAKATHLPVGKVVIRNGLVVMDPTNMAANAADEIYILWQITGSHRPLAVGSFDVRPGAHEPIKLGALAASYRDTLAFAVSLEHGRTIPAAPSPPVALGQVS